MDPHLRELADAVRGHPRRVTSDFVACEHLDYEPDYARFPYYGKLVESGGKDLKKNALIRLEMLDRADRDAGFADDLWEMCAQDLLFYVNTFVWTHDSRLIAEGQNPNVPFVTYPYQDWIYTEILDSVGRGDLNSQKSRDLGWSWSVLTAIDWYWRFDHRQFTFLLVSAKAELVDWVGNPDTLFAKLDHIDRTLPWFLQPTNGMERYTFHRLNQDNRSVITGSASVADVGRAGRQTMVYFDELSSFPRKDDAAAWAATQKSTRCRIVTSTPKGEGTQQAQLRRLKGVRTVTTHWTDHPIMSRGLYWGDERQLDVLDARYPFPADYKFRRDGRWRSPYYDAEEDRVGSGWIMAQEFDVSYQSESRPFFDAPTLDRLIAECRRPNFVGELDFDRDTLAPRDLTPLYGGKLRLWMPSTTRPNAGWPYVMGVDVAMGTAGQEASNSVISVWDCSTGQKVAEYVDNASEPSELAKVAIALGRWFGGGFGARDGAKMIWEQNGPGNIFRRKIVECGYTNLYYRPKNEHDVRMRLSTLPGFHSNTANKLSLFAEYRRALAVGEAKNCSKPALEECRFYRYMDSTSSGVEWGGTGGSLGKADVGEAHGDRCVADALGWKLVVESQYFRQKNNQPVSDDQVPQNTLAWRHQQARKGRLELVQDWY